MEEVQASLKELNIKKKVVENSLEAVVHFLENNELRDENRYQFKAKWELVIGLMNKYESISDGMLGLIDEGDSLIQFSKEYDEFTAKIYETKILLSDKLQNWDRSPSVSKADVKSVNSDQGEEGNAIVIKKEEKLNIKLPKVEIDKFDGQLDKWLRFYETFGSIIHNNTNLSDLQKFHYLIIFVEGEAADVIGGIELSEANYGFAWERLVSRYKNNRKLVETHLSNLFTAKSVDGQSSRKLRELCNTFVKNLNALKKLGINLEGCDPFLLYLVGSKLDKGSLRAWEEETGSSKEMPSFRELEIFLETRCNWLETYESKGGSNTSNWKMGYKGAGRVTLYSKGKQCLLCKGLHALIECREFNKLELQEKRDFIMNNKLCWLCLNVGHIASSCTELSGCQNCSGKHNTVLCYKGGNSASPSGCHGNGYQAARQPSKESPTHDNNRVFVNKNFKTGKTLLPTVKGFIYDIKGTPHELCFILDSGSELNLLTYDAIDKLKLPVMKEAIQINGLNKVATNVKEVTFGTLFSKVNDFKQEIKFNLIDNITDFNGSTFKYYNNQLKGLPKYIRSKLADDEFENENKVIHGLLGVEIFCDILNGNNYRPFNSKLPYFFETKFGWVAAGRLNGQPKVNERHSVFLSSTSNGIITKGKIKAENELLCENIFKTTVQREKGGRFIVTLPKLKPPDVLGNSLEGAKKRFYNLERKFNKDKHLRLKYSEFINEYIKLGHMELVPVNEVNKFPNYYLPHHPVIRDSETTSLRVVYDASHKGDNDLSLNDILLIGPPLQNDLFKLLIKFRTWKYGLMGDIEKMYRQIRVQKDDCELQRIVWRESPDQPLNHYRLLTVTYGTNCAPYLSIKCLHEIAREIRGSDSELADIIINNFYMDDLMFGANTSDDIISWQGKISKVLENYGLLLRKWCTNDVEIRERWTKDTDTPHYCVNLDKNGVTKALGLLWDPNEDKFIFQCNNWNQEGYLTKRKVISDIQRFWDPIGFWVPVFIKGKMFVQELWLEGYGWDTPLPQKLQVKWLNFRNNLISLNNGTVSRRVFTGIDNTVVLHGFSDASIKAYGCCIYAVTIDDEGNFNSNLVCAKGRVAPKSQQSLPRLELLGAALLVKLMQDTIRALGIKGIECHYWTDSEIVLTWLSGKPQQWQTYVGNRVHQIQEVSNSTQWHHVPSKSNPADLTTRGVEPKELMKQTLWWGGPLEVMKNPECWRNINKNNVQDIPESRKITYSLLNRTDEWDLLNRFSKWKKLVRVMAYVLRFIDNCRGRKKYNGLKVDELNRAEINIIKQIQQLEFSTEVELLKNQKPLPKRNPLLSLSIYLDNNGVLRVGGRLQNANLSEDHQHPILLPKTHHVTKLILRQIHEDNCHAPPTLLLALCRTQYWPIRGKGLAKEIVKGCVRCVKSNPSLHSAIMGNLPSERVTPARCFSVTGVDFCGPVFIKTGIRKSIKVKAYIAVFVCFTTKAIHLELVSDLTADAFLAALRRFISRRGKPTIIYSDNGTNFTGARKKLEGWFNQIEKISESCAGEKIEWRFIPPGSPHFGGLWEAAVKSLKYHLVRIIGGGLLNFEEMYTLLTQIEACLNSRPITVLSADPSDPSALTPAHFLVNSPLTSPVEPDYTEAKSGRLKRWEMVQQMRQHFWKRWSLEYLSSLQQRGKWKVPTPNITIGTVIVLKEENLPPGEWKLGVVTEVHPGRDGVVRVVSVRTASGAIYTRPIVKVAALPVEKQD